MKFEKLYNQVRGRSLRSDDDGFTLIELVIVVVIIAILAAIAIPIFLGQQRAAIESTVQADVSHNKSMMSPGKEGRLYKTPEAFLSSAAVSPGNIIFYTVSDDGSQACTHTLYEFGEDDVAAYRIRGEHGQIEKGLCPSYGNNVIAEGDPEGEPQPVEEEELPGEEEEGEYEHPAEGGGLYPIYPANGDTVLDVELTVNETGRACFVVKINTTSETGAPWAFRADKTVSPFLNNFIPSDGGDGRYVREDRGDHYYVYGTAGMRDASTTIQRVYGAGQSFCAQSPSGQPIERPAVSTSITALTPPSGNQWYATQKFVISNNSLYHSSWTTQVDLTDLLEQMNRTPQNVNLQVQTAGSMKIEHLNGNMYRVYNDNNGYWAIHKDKTIDIIIQGSQG